MECVVKNKISKEDTVIIMWSNIAREDRYVNGKWLFTGNIFSQNTYDKTFVKKFADNRGYFIRDMNSIYATYTILKNIGCNFVFLSMVPMTNPYPFHKGDSLDELNDLLEYFESTLQQIKPSIYEIVFNFDWYSRPYDISNTSTGSFRQEWYQTIRSEVWPNWAGNDTDFIKTLSNTIKKECLEVFGLDLYNNSTPPFKRVDLHPTPSEHLEYIEKVLPEIAISKSTKDWVTLMDNNQRLYGKSFWKRSPEIVRW